MIVYFRLSDRILIVKTYSRTRSFGIKAPDCKYKRDIRQEVLRIKIGDRFREKKEKTSCRPKNYIIFVGRNSAYMIESRKS